MLLGIDVGGTFTDAVIIKDCKVFAKTKIKTTHDDISKGLLNALDEVLKKVDDTEQIRRIAISTTIITNAVATNKLPKANIFVLPGPGMNCEKSFAGKAIILDGYTDHQGYLVAQTVIDNEKIQQADKSQPSIVSAKFSVRNPHGELNLQEYLCKEGFENIVCASDMSGQLGFIRRTNSAYYTATTMQLFESFLNTIKKSLNDKGITAPIYILKADGGTMPEKLARKHTVEAVFTGPAASAIGIKALINPKDSSISLDIGGTTTDIAFWEKGEPLLANRGALINGYPTSVRALHLKSLPIGGDSQVKNVDGKITVGPDRIGQAMALGGGQPTVTDAFLALGFDDFGDKDLAIQAMKMLAVNGESELQIARSVVDVAVSDIIAAIKEMTREYSLQPVYKVQDVVEAKTFIPNVIIGVGGAAKGIVPQVAQKMGVSFDIPNNAVVANAIGAALARPTIMCSLMSNTTLGTCIMPEAKKQYSVNVVFSVDDAKELVKNWLKEQAENLGIEFYGIETIYLQRFAVVDDGWSNGEIINLAMQLIPGVFGFVKGDDC